MGTLRALAAKLALLLALAGLPVPAPDAAHPTATAPDHGAANDPGRDANLLVRTDLPVLQIEAPPAMAPLAERVRRFDPAPLGLAMRLTGLREAGPPIRVALVEEGSDPARSAPEWALGYARGGAGTIVLIPSRARSYPYGSLESLLHHEVAHVLVARAAGGRPVPRWFNEGLAMIAGREWTMGDRSRLFIELLPGSRVPVSRLDELFDRTSRAGADRAYTLSAALVRDLVDRYGVDFPGAVLAGLARGETFEDAFRRATGVPLEVAAASFYRRQSFWSLWLPALTSTATFWTGVTLLALWAAKKRREKSERIRQGWEAEEALEELPRGFGVPPSFGLPPTNGSPPSGPPRGEN